MANCGCSGGKKVIVLIDDDPDIVESVSAVITSAGFAVKTAANGEEGLQVIRQCKPDLILCDLMMETVDAGVQVAGHLQDMAAKAPVYLLSSVGDSTNYTLDVRELGIAGTIQKPIDPDALIALIRNALHLK